MILQVRAIQTEPLRTLELLNRLFELALSLIDEAKHAVGVRVRRTERERSSSTRGCTREVALRGRSGISSQWNRGISHLAAG
jgi:hypothetical protein